MPTDDKLKGIYDKTVNSNGVPFSGDTSALNLSAPLIGDGIPSDFTTLESVAANTQPLPESFSEFRNRTGNVDNNTQPYESFSEYRNRIGNVNNISEEVEKKEIKVKPKIENIGESFSEFRGRGNTRGFYNIPSNVTVNEDEFIVDKNRAFYILSTIQDENVPSARARNLLRTTNEAKYKEVYGANGKVYE
jgi:hypothetical protein